MSTLFKKGQKLKLILYNFSCISERYNTNDIKIEHQVI